MNTDPADGHDLAGTAAYRVNHRGHHVLVVLMYL